MKLARRIGLTAAITAALLLFGWGTIFASIWASGGLITVSVRPGEEGGRFYLAVPVALVDAAAVAGGSLLESHEPRLEAHLGEWQPLVLSVLEVLDDCPDATLVEVVDGPDRVRVVKRRGRLEVEVDAPDVAVRVSVPTRGLARTASRLLI